MKTRPKSVKTATRTWLPRPQDGQLAARRLGRIVGRPDDPPLVLQDREDLAPLVDVIAQGDAVDAGGQQVRDRSAASAPNRPRRSRRWPRQIDACSCRSPRQGLRADLPARLADDVADEKKTHEEWLVASD